MKCKICDGEYLKAIREDGSQGFVMLTFIDKEQTKDIIMGGPRIIATAMICNYCKHIELFSENPCIL